MSFHPFVQIRAGDLPITTVPPERLQNFSYKSAVDALSLLQFSAIDPTFKELEQILLQADDTDNAIYFRFGHLENVGSINRDWIKSRLVNFVPNITHRGTQVNAVCLVDAVQGIATQKTRTYSGKISKVVRQIAEDIGAIPEVEETDDDENDAFEDNNGDPRLWTVRNQTLIEFIRTELLPIARSKTSPSNYDLWVTGGDITTGGGDQPPVLHFHTKDFPDCRRRKRRVLELQYLAGKTDRVVEFNPEYSGKILGNFGAASGQVVTRIFDPDSGRYISEVHNRKVDENTLSVGTGTKTTAAPSNPADAKDDTEAQAVLYSRELTLKQASDQGRSSWEIGKAITFTANITLVGLPELVFLEANDYIDIKVIVPDPSTGQFAEHWSGGLYRIYSADHQIGDNYMITCALQRDLAAVGGEVVKGPKLLLPSESDT